MRHPGIGDRLAGLLSALGITEERVYRLFGGCRCGEMRRWINRRRTLHKIAGWLGAKVQYDDGQVW